MFSFGNTEAVKDQSEKEGYNIMKKVRDQARIHRTKTSEVLMVIQNKNKRKRERYFNHLKKVKGKENRGMVKFFQPSSVKGTSLLSVSHDDEEGTNQWIYLPAFRSIKKLSTKEKNQSFMGSDFSISDIAGRNLKQDQHKLIKKDNKYFYVMSKPKSKEDQYSKLKFKVHKKFYVPIEIKFYNKKKKHFKTMKNIKLKKIKGMYLVTKSIMENHKTKGRTTLNASKIKVGISILDNDIGIRGLKK